MRGRRENLSATCGGELISGWAYRSDCCCEMSKLRWSFITRCIVVSQISAFDTLLVLCIRFSLRAVLFGIPGGGRRCILFLLTTLFCIYPSQYPAFPFR